MIVLSEEQRIALGLRPSTLAGFVFWLRYYSRAARIWQLRGQPVRDYFGRAFRPYDRRRWLRWLHPLRGLCSLGWHRDDGEIGNDIAGSVRHCGRCFRPWIKGRP